MKDVIEDIDRWLVAGSGTIALATVIDTWGSAPRKVGAKMAFTRGGAAIAGSVSGGCVEGAVIEAGEQVLDSGRPCLLHFGVADETAWGVGLACGGTIDVYVERLDPAIYAVARAWVVAGESGAVVTVVAAPDDRLGRKMAIDNAGTTTGSLGPALGDIAAQLTRRARQSARHPLPDGVNLFVDLLRPGPSVSIVGGAHIAVALAQMARLLGYRVTVIDPRRAFGNAARFPDADRLVQAWPDKAFAEVPIDAETAVVTLSHDPKIDDPALREALRSDAFYVGALGSRKTNAKRRERLAAAGLVEEQLARIHAPVGLDIGADTPEEIALAIMAQIVAAHRRKETV